MLGHDLFLLHCYQLSHWNPNILPSPTLFLHCDPTRVMASLDREAFALFLESKIILITQFDAHGTVHCDIFL
jgi:hypothetical protein